MTCTHGHTLRNCGECLDRSIESQQRPPAGSKGIDMPPLLKADVATTSEQRRRAQVAVAARAHGAEDCAELLEALGLGEVGV